MLDKEVPVKFPVSVWNEVLVGLSKRPYDEVVQIIASIRAQVQSGVDAANNSDTPEKVSQD